MRWSLCFVVLGIGCGGGNFCEREYCGETSSEAEIEMCNEQIEGCSSSDLKKLNAFLDCLEEIPGICGTETTTATGADGLGDLLACSAEAEGISAECQAIQFSATFSTDTGF